MPNNPLTQEECDQLPEGFLIDINWSGGNTGRFRVAIGSFGNRYAVYHTSYDQVREILDGKIGGNASGSFQDLNGVSSTNPKMTQVWRVIDGQK